MPSYGYSSFSNDPHRWERCRQQAKQDMLEAGWDKHASKFGTVQHKKAIKLWNTGFN